MRKVIFSTMVSLDGFIEGPNRELDWPIIDGELHRYVNDQCRAMGAFLYGRRTYEVMVAYWPTADANPSAPDFEVEFSRIWKAMPKIVFSKTLEKTEGNARLVRENVVEEVTKLKAQSGKDLLLLGGADLASTFMRHRLIDEYEIYVHPVVLGGGTPLFKTLDDRIHLRLVETRTFGSGVVLLRYWRADEV